MTHVDVDEEVTATAPDQEGPRLRATIGTTAHRAMVRYFTALSALNPEQIADAFEPNGEIEDPVGTEVATGREQIAAHFAPMCQALVRLPIEVVTEQPAGDSIAAHWRMIAQARNGHHVKWEGIDVLQVGPDGLIVRAEGYWDLQGFIQALG